MSSQERTGWSLDLLMVRNIPVRIHYSFFLLPLFVFLSNRDGVAYLAMELLLLVLMFTCIALHELGHAFAARHFGIQTRDIVLYPFGGVATITGQPGPRAELVVAAAGPLVNVVIAALLYPLIQFSSRAQFFSGQSLLTQLFIANVILVLFNAIPALPMDGGRIMRAALLLFGVKKATLISARISQILSACMVLTALYFSHAILTIIGVLIFTQASQELVKEKTSRAVAGLRVRDLMVDRMNIETLSHGMSVAEALACIIKSFQDFFPVVHGNRVVGLIARDEILRAAASGENTNYIAEFMQRDFLVVSPDDVLADVLKKFSFRSGYPILVMDNDGFTGLLLPDALAELLFLEGFHDRNTKSNTKS